MLLVHRLDAFSTTMPRYDIYARVCMLLGFSAFVQSLAFYGPSPGTMVRAELAERSRNCHILKPRQRPHYR